MKELEAGFTQIRKESLSDKIHDQILEMIIRSPSDEDQVLNEKRLMEAFGVSKAPVREALIKLCSEGVLRSVPRFGYVVVRMREQDIRDATKVRAILELQALQMSIPNLTEERLEKLRSQIERAATRQNVDVWEVWEDNEEFHTLLASFSENQILMKFIRECMDLQKRIYAQRVWNQRNSMADSVNRQPHFGIYKKLCEGDMEAAANLLQQDIIDVLI